MAISEPNTILEINEAHADNYILVIPRLPTSPYLSSVFNQFTSPSSLSSQSSGTSATPEVCDDISQSRLRREANTDLKNFMLYVSDVNLPAVNMQKVDIPTQFANLTRPSKIVFNDLSINMLVSENLLNYNILLYWLYALHNPEEYNKLFGREMIDEFFVDIHLIITNNHREKVAEYKFLDAWPLSIGELPFTSKSAEKLTLPVSFSHSGMFATNNFVLKYV